MKPEIIKAVKQKIEAKLVITDPDMIIARRIGSQLGIDIDGIVGNALVTMIATLLQDPSISDTLGEHGLRIALKASKPKLMAFENALDDALEKIFNSY